MHKFLDLHGHSRTGCGEEVLTLQAQILQQQGDDRLFVEHVLHLQPDGRHKPAHAILDIVLLANFQGVEHEVALYGAAGVYLLLHTGIDLLPETRNCRHAGGVHLKHGLQHVLRAQVHCQRGTEADAEIAPCPLENVGEGQEVQYHILVGEWQRAYVGTESEGVLAMGLHNALRQSGRAARIEYVGKVVGLQLVGTLLHLFIMGQPLAHFQEFIEVNAGIVLCVALYRTVEDYELAQVGFNLHHAQSSVVLILFTHKDIADVGIGNHVTHLGLTAGGIEGYRHGSYGIGSEVAEQTFGLVLGEDCNLFLNLDTQFQHGVTYELNGFRELIP